MVPRLRQGSGTLPWALRLICLSGLLLGALVYAQGPEPIIPTAPPSAPGTPGRAAPAAAPAAQPTAPGTPAAAPRAAAPMVAAAPASPAAPSISSSGKLPTFLELFGTNTIINSIITALSVLAVMLFIYYLLTINTRSMMPAAFVDDVTRLALARRYDEAADYCRARQHLLAASILQRCFENADKDQEILMRIIDSEGARRADLVWNRISYLIDLSVIAPMLGLLGTVLGMLQAFLLLPESTPGAGLRTALLARSIGGAMSATFFGLIVAILALIFHTIIKSRTVSTLAEVEQVVHSLADHVKRGQVVESRTA